MDDLISRKAAIELYADEENKDLESPRYSVPIPVIIQNLKDLPAADPIKHGYWKRYNTYHGDDTSGFVDPDWRCSECGKKANINEWFMYDRTDFCPNCGAKMDKLEDDDYDYDRTIDELEYSILYEPTFNVDDGSM